MKKPLEGKYILVTGVGLKPVNAVFHDLITGKPSHDEIVVNGKPFKANIGAATAKECAKAGATVYLVARTEEKLKQVAAWIKEEVYDAQIEFIACDFSKKEEMTKLVTVLPKDFPLYWVQSVGLGAGTVQLQDDNPYQKIENISEELIDAELTVLKNTIQLLQLLLPIFRTQPETKICIVSSMSAVRSFISGSIHNAAKGAMSRFSNAAMLELDQERIFITDVRPGGVDTGLYDNETVQKTVEHIAQTYKYDWSANSGGLRLMPPSTVGEAIVAVLSSKAHITSINLVAQGQWPHEGS